jgi:Transglutaminase-like superfamily
VGPTASGGRELGRPIGRRAFLALSGALGLGIVGATRAVGQSPSASPVPFPAPTSSDPIADLADSLGLDVERIFRFVADEIRYQPYAGILRGPTGTLASRAGNAADQAALLAALLQAAAVPVRFAWGALDDATAATLLGSTTATADEARQYAVDALLGPQPTQTSPAPSLDPSTAAQLQRPGSNPDDIASWLGDQLDGTIASLTGALSAAGIQLPSGFSDVSGPEQTQHLWVQAGNGAEWQDLDPSMAGQPAGETLADAQGTVGVLPDDLRHTVKFEVVAEKVTDHALAETTLLGVTRTSEDLANAPILLVNVDPSGLKAVGVDIAAGLEGWKSYVAVLGIGNDAWTSSGFLQFATDSGVFSPTGPAPEGETTAEWLQATVSRPGTDPQVVRRVIFDRIGDAARAAGTIDLSRLSPVTLTSLGPDLDQEYAPARNAMWLTVTSGAPTAERIATVDDPSGLVKMAALPHGYQWTRELAAASIGVARGVRAFPNEPNIAALAFRIDGTGTVSAPSELALDILHRGFGRLPLSDVASSVPPALVGGVLAQVAERLLARALAGSSGTKPAEPVGVGAVFDAATTAGIPLRVIQGAIPSDVTVPPAALGRLNDWLARAAS